MALINVHKIMMTAALLFCGLFAARGFVTGDSVTGCVFAVLALGLAGYFRWFLAKKVNAED
jgi:hypothetical protein